MTKRPTIADVARAAQVSPATVDRVLSGRMKVREETARKVHEAAETVGYHAAGAIRQRLLSDRPELKLGVVTAFLGVPIFLLHLIRERRLW